MNKPEKDRLPVELKHSKYTNLFNEIRNEAITEYEAFLPDRAEIESILFHILSAISYAAFGKHISAAIAKRIGKGE